VPAPDPPPAAVDALGAALPSLRCYADLLATAGIERGLIGPGETDRIWERHLLNCAVVAPALRGPRVLDLGSGAGLPGIVLAILRPDLTFVLLDATRRRVDFLDEVLAALGLANVTTRWARAESLAGDVAVDEVVARAVAPLGRLAAWALPLLRPGGRLLAVKGATAGEEIAAEGDGVRRAGGEVRGVREYGMGLIDPPAVVVEVVRGRAARKAARR
jgi:16S rRNA (guanine527-N7)-methyltransferase